MTILLNNLSFALYIIKNGTLGINDPGVTLTVLELLLRSIHLFSCCFKLLYFLYRMDIKIFMKIISPSIDKSIWTSDMKAIFSILPSLNIRNSSKQLYNLYHKKKRRQGLSKNSTNYFIYGFFLGAFGVSSISKPQSPSFFGLWLYLPFK